MMKLSTSERKALDLTLTKDWREFRRSFPNLSMRGLAFTARLGGLVRSRGCYGMWVGVDRGNAAAHATYRAAGGNKAEPCEVITWTF